MFLTGVATENGASKTGLTPTIKIWDLADNSLNQASAVEVGLGLYTYNFTTRKDVKHYLFLYDFVTLTFSERYAVGSAPPDWNRDWVTAYVTEQGSPKTGLTVKLTIFNLTDNALLLTATMTEVDFGFYKYEFTTWNRSKEYGFICETGLSNDELAAYGIIDQPIITGRVTYPQERDVRRNTSYGPNGRQTGSLRPGGGTFTMPIKKPDEEVMEMIKTFMETGSI